MTTTKSERSSNVAPENIEEKPIISLDWLAVISALVLAAIIFFGLTVTW